MVRFGSFLSGLARLDSIRARNAGSLPVWAIRLSVASAAAFSNVCGPDDEQAASANAVPSASSTAPSAPCHERAANPLICIPS